jgi:hypothetical protein
MVAPGNEGFRVIRAIHRVAGKQPAKKEHFLHEEGPHAKSDRILLLHSIIELMGNKRIVMSRRR